MKEQDLLDSASPSFPNFIESKHHILCSELKQLYVAVTRTRQRLWICENSELSKPMFDYWMKKCLVQVRQLDDSLAQAMQVASSPEEWRSRGIKVCLIILFQKFSGGGDDEDGKLTRMKIITVVTVTATVVEYYYYFPCKFYCYHF